MRKQGISDIGLLFTVEEEEGGAGAKVANHASDSRKNANIIINGEPTDNDLAIGSKGSLRFYIRTKGIAGHSAYPEMGESAIEKLLEILNDVLKIEFPVDDFYGETTNNIGTISGGLKTNVIAPNAEAGLHIRTTGDEKPILERIAESRRSAR